MEKEKLISILDLVEVSERNKSIYIDRFIYKNSFRELSIKNGISTASIKNILDRISYMIDGVNSVKQGNTIYNLKLGYVISNILLRNDIKTVEELLEKISIIQEIKGLGLKTYKTIRNNLLNYLKENNQEDEYKNVLNCKLEPSKKLKSNSNKIIMKYYCPVCNSNFSTFIESEGIKYNNPNYCPVCSNNEMIENEENEYFDLKEFN